MMHVHEVMSRCRWCGREVHLSFLRRLFASPLLCRTDREACASIGWAMRGEPPEPEPPDPDSIPPKDLFLCSSCLGHGELFVRQDWETGAIHTTPCRICGGSGDWPFP